MSCEILVVAAHPDDAELTCAGTILKATKAGKRVVIADCTKGELGTRGTPEIREREAAEAAQLMGVDTRVCLDMPDGAVSQTQENILNVVSVIRAFRPRIILTTPPLERHPDHEAVHRLVRAATFTAGLAKVKTQWQGADQEPFRPKRTLSFMQWFDLPGGPDVYVDVTEVYEQRTKAIMAFASQFHLPEAYQSDEPQTLLSRPEFFEELDARAIHFGSRIGVRYAEAFKAVEPLGLASITDLL